MKKGEYYKVYNDDDENDFYLVKTLKNKEGNSRELIIVDIIEVSEKYHRTNKHEKEVEFYWFESGWIYKKIKESEVIQEMI